MLFLLRVLKVLILLPLLLLGSVAGTIGAPAFFTISGIMLFAYLKVRRIAINVKTSRALPDVNTFLASLAATPRP